MKNVLNFVLMLSVAFVVYSCKEKQAETLAEGASADGLEFTVSTDNSKIMWTGSKPGGQHIGNINVSEGKVYVKDGKITAGSFTLDMNSITVTDLEGDDKASLESHLKGTGKEGSEDFFNVTKYPTGKFEITSVMDTTMESGANAMVKGNLTLLDKTKEVAIPVSYTATDSTLVVSSYAFTINRTDWGINYKSKNIFKEIGDKFIDDDISLRLKFNATLPVQEKK